MNIWGIPNWLEAEVTARDKRCVYCGIEMVYRVPHGLPRKTAATWEHIINDASIVTRENIALCCSACNSSKGARLLTNWIQSPYCAARGINKDTVAQVVKDALQQPPAQTPDCMFQPTIGADTFEFHPALDLRFGNG